MPRFLHNRPHCNPHVKLVRDFTLKHPAMRYALNSGHELEYPESLRGAFDVFSMHPGLAYQHQDEQLGLHVCVLLRVTESGPSFRTISANLAEANPEIPSLPEDEQERLAFEGKEIPADFYLGRTGGTAETRGSYLLLKVEECFNSEKGWVRIGVDNRWIVDEPLCATPRR